MRGRTNITQRSGLVPVNGDVKEFTVADGEKINIGDFVSTWSNDIIPFKLNNTWDGSSIFKISNVRVIYFYSNNIVVLNLENNSITVEKEILGSFTKGKIFQINENRYVSVYNVASTNTYKECNISVDFITINLENNSVTVETKEYKNTIDSFYGSKVFSMYKSLMLNNILFIPFSSKSSSSSNYVNIVALAWYDLNSNDCGYELLSNYNYVFDSASNVIITKGEDNEIYLFTHGFRGQSKLCVSKFTFNYEGKILELIYSRDISISYSPLLTENNSIIYVGNNIFLINISSYICIIELGLENATILSLITNSNSKLYFQYYKIGNNIIIFASSSSSSGKYIYDSIYITTIENLLNISNITFNTLPFILYKYRGVEHGDCLCILDLVDKLLVTSNYDDSSTVNFKSLLCKIENGLLVSVDSYNIVRLYNGNSLGFAKTGGTSGETIQVYVPKSN